MKSHCSCLQLCYNYISCWRKTDQLASQTMLGVFLPCWSLNWPVMGYTARSLRENCSWQPFHGAERNSSSFHQAWRVLKATWRVTDGLATTQWAEWAWIAQGSFDIQNIRKHNNKIPKLREKSTSLSAGWLGSISTFEKAKKKKKTFIQEFKWANIPIWFVRSRSCYSIGQQYSTLGL